jgi:hypothetical protein
MPTITFDANRRAQTIAENIKQELPRGYDLNPGQQAQYDKLDVLATAVVTVYIAGPKVDISVEAEVQVGNYPEYISIAATGLQESATQAIEAILKGDSSYISDAYASL